MQFKNPEVLYFLVVLIIPVLVHLFQLQKFVKIPFTNVAFLKKLEQQTRKSSRIKKWLILATRMLLFSAILFAFSQPYFSNKTANTKQQNFIYLDNSMSLNAKGEKGNLLKIAAQEIIENASEKDIYSLQTNADFHTNLSKSELKSILLKLKNTSKKIDLNTVLLKINNLNSSKTNTLHNNILISDFHNTYKKEFTNVTTPFSLVKLNQTVKNNISIDSVFISSSTIEKLNVKVVIRNQGNTKENIPITLFNKQKLISKHSFSIEKNSEKTVEFNLDKQDGFLGKLQITFNDTFSFDNTFLFSINAIEKINILAIGSNNNFLSKIYNNSEFNFTKSNTENINFNAIQKQQLIILNEIENISLPLQNSLVKFSKNGGNLVIIPNEKLSLKSYNNFFRKLKIGTIEKKVLDTLKITNINFGNPFFKNVFYKRVQNFQYPNSKHYFPTSFSKSSNLISFENNIGFAKQMNKNGSTIFWFASSLVQRNSNFTNSPLVVPVFYNFGQMSLQPSRIYYTLFEENKIDVNTSLGKNEILSIKNKENSFIPLQQTFQNKATITTLNQPEKPGFYSVLKKKDTLKNLAYNITKTESNLSFLNAVELANENENITVSSSVKDFFKDINKKNKVHWLWKWFLALAIVSLLLEILILKFFKS